MPSSSRCQSRPAPLLPACIKRRQRRTAADAATAATHHDSSSWASLHEDLINLIAWRALAGDLRDYVRLRAACRHWRSSAACPRGRGIVDRRFHPRRWMLFPEGHGKLCGHVRFFNLSTGAFVRVRLPIFRDHCVLETPSTASSSCCSGTTTPPVQSSMTTYTYGHSVLIASVMSFGLAMDLHAHSRLVASLTHK